jgi:hypothetical protein
LGFITDGSLECPGDFSYSISRLKSYTFNTGNRYKNEKSSPLWQFKGHFRISENTLCLTHHYLIDYDDAVNRINREGEFTEDMIWLCFSPALAGELALTNHSIRLLIEFIIDTLQNHIDQVVTSWA